ncbi:transcriptional regulator [Synechococcus sp. HB1133]|uniref:helix-turn-helix domain-containing protein n=1 Tax=unclassified Synechococcus TaxID=2626047 RepID=UPI00140E053D|nr:MULTISPECIES: helix-turn-helix domain-containing protein [unclassified Synechococcus]MCB4394796.1 transcriptional regulator [Synechococcus sp. PH41509]MCB4422849.1 transcriptional regulator [Synechococcus sp. HB1133]MCB4429660.1 transcriptional regulator [Synechococcus sp. HBA1120]NHI81797.1 helix-turn-helix domain-containing protein [Synechococcus sp. HB1133]
MHERSLTEDQSKDAGLVQVGRQLAEARSGAGLTQDQLASQMHMGVEQLIALERGDQDALPEPVFIKAMVRRLSSHLGLDADAMVQAIGPLSTSKTKQQAPGPTTRGIAPQKQERVNLLPLVALAGLTGLGVVVWSNASELSRFAQGLRPASRTLVVNEPASPPEAKTDVELEGELESLIVPAPPTAQTGLTISSSEPSWIALRREGIVEFEGLLHGERRIEDPELVEIYAGRPDLVQLTSPNTETRTLGAVDDIRWIRLNPEL